jgi:copper homeostasis protein
MQEGVLIEACVDSVAAAEAAIAGGADRIELCDFRVPDGITPGFLLIEEVLRRSLVPVHVMVRPQGGSFEYGSNPNDSAVLAQQIAAVRGLGVPGIVIGALTPANQIDSPLMTDVIQRARPMAVTFHRAFDATPDPEVALEVLINLGGDRVLTSGHAPDAEAGIPGLGRLVRRAAGRIGIIAAGGIREHNVARIVRETGVREIHSRGDVAGLIRGLWAG